MTSIRNQFCMLYLEVTAALSLSPSHSGMKSLL